MSTHFEGEIRVDETIDFDIDCSTVFNLSDPADQINTLSWAVEDGSVTLGTAEIQNGTKAVVPVSAPSLKLYSYHFIRATITTVSGQIYKPGIRIRIVK